MKTIAISGRVAENDFEYLMSYPLAGKVTISDKLRHALAFFREKHEGNTSYEECFELLKNDLMPFLKELKASELNESLRSQLIEEVANFVTEMAALLISSRISGDDTAEALKQLEQTVFQKTMRFVEAVLRLGITKHSPTYNPTIFQNQWPVIEELVEIKQLQTKA